MKCFFEFMGVKISLSTQNVNIIDYCKDYFENYFSFYNQECNEATMSIDIVEYFARENNYILEKEKPFKIYLHRFDKKMVIVNVGEENYRELMRLIRELFIYHVATTKKCCFLHAACVSKDGFAIALTGDKFAGKTTMCLNFLQDGWDYISNDKLVIVKEDDIVCWGLPIALGVREGTKQLFSNKFDDLEMDPEDRRYYLTPNQLIDKFKVKVANGIKLKLLLIPNYCPEVEEVSFEKLTNVEANSFLKRQCLSAVYSDRVKLKNFVAYCNENLISDLIRIPIYRIKTNERINQQIKIAIKNFEDRGKLEC